MPELERRDYDGLAAPAGAFHHSVRWGNMLFLCGNTARGTTAENGTAGEQTDAILDKMDVILKANGASLANVVKVTSFVTDLREGARDWRGAPSPLRWRLPCQHPSAGSSLGYARHQNRDRGHRRSRLMHWWPH